MHTNCGHEFFLPSTESNGKIPIDGYVNATICGLTFMGLFDDANKIENLSVGDCCYDENGTFVVWSGSYWEPLSSGDDFTIPKKAYSKCSYCETNQETGGKCKCCGAWV